MVQLVLARILGPEQFGLVAMVAVFIVVSQVLVDAGLGSAIIQRKTLSQVDLNSVFLFNQLASVFLVVILWMVAPLVAAFYRQPELSPILRTLGLGIVLGAFGGIHRAILQRDLRFSSLFWVSTPANLISGGIGIGMALRGFGVWSLVTQTLSRNAMESCMYWFHSDWRPTSRMSRASLRELLPYGARLAGASVLNEGFRDIYVLVIGRVFSPLEVGYFQRASQLSRYPVANLQAVIERVTFPLLASIQEQKRRVKVVLSKGIQIISLIVFPGTALLGAMAQPLILVLLGEKWMAMVPLFQIMCISAALYPVHVSNLSLLKAAGRSDLYLRLEIIKKAITLVSIAITAPIGLMAMAIGMVATSAIALVVNTYYTNRLVDYGLMDQLKDILPFVMLGGLIWGAGLTVSAQVALPAWETLLVGLGVSSVIMIAAIRFLPDAVKEEIVTAGKRIPVLGRWLPLLTNIQGASGRG